MPRLTRLHSGLTALAGAMLLLACTERPVAEAAPAQAPVPPAPTPAASAAPVAVGGAVGQPPKGFEALEAVTPTGRARFFVEIADNDAERERGLMFRKELGPDRGMLFDFHRDPHEVAFWMKNTLIPLDIIYIQQGGTVLSIARNTTPLSEAPIPSGGEVVAVLEIAGGRAEQIGLMPGDRIEHRIFSGG